MSSIRPEVQELVRQRASAAAGRRPRRQLVTSGAVALAIAGAALLLTAGSPSKGGLLSPDQAVAEAARNLDGEGVLHWVRRGDFVPGRSLRDTRDEGHVIEEQWFDLVTGDSHATTKTFLGSARQPSEVGESWSSGGKLWTTIPAGPGGAPEVRQIPGAPRAGRHRPFDPITSVDDVRAMLERADRGESEITDAGESEGVPVVVVTDRSLGVVIRTWITREPSPRVVRTTADLTCSTSNPCAGTTSDGASGAVTTTMVTQTWQIELRTETALASVALPPETPGAQSAG